MEINYVHNGDLNVDDIMSVFRDAGWNKNENIIIDAFKNSYYIIAYDGDKIVGFSRAISDGCYYTGIYDVIVKKAYQKQGIAKKMVTTLVEQFKRTYLFLTYTDGNKAFYEHCGFKENNQSMWIPL